MAHLTLRRPELEQGLRSCGSDPVALADGGGRQYLVAERLAQRRHGALAGAEAGALHPAEIDAESCRVALEGVFLRAAVEQQRVANVAAHCRDQAGEAMNATAHAAVRRDTQAPPRGEGPFVLDVERRDGEAVDRVVDWDLDFDAIGFDEVGHAGGRSPFSGSDMRACLYDDENIGQTQAA